MLFLVEPSVSEPYYRAETGTMNQMHINPSDVLDVVFQIELSPYWWLPLTINGITR